MNIETNKAIGKSNGVIFKTYLQARHLKKASSKSYALTIIIVTYNDHDGLEKTIMSLKEKLGNSSRRSHELIEIIVYDGMSTDGTYTLLREGHVACDWIRDDDAGIYDAMNRSAHLASGKYLFFLNSGDTLTIDRFEHVLSLLANIDADIAYFSTQHRKADGTTWVMRPKKPGLAWIGNICSHQGCMVKTKAFKELRGFKLEYGVVADWALMSQILMHKSSVHFEGFCFCKTAPFGVSESYKTRLAQRYAVASVLFANVPELDSFYKLIFSLVDNEPPPFLLHQQIVDLASSNSISIPEACKLFQVDTTAFSANLKSRKDVLSSCNKSVYGTRQIQSEFQSLYSKSLRLDYPVNTFVHREIDESNLLFLISMPRGGSSLLQRMLMTSSSICSLSEPWILLKLLGSYMPDHISLHSSRLTDIAIEANSCLSGLDSNDLDSQLRSLCLNYYNQLTSLGFRERWHRGCYLLDKTPRYILIYEAIRALFPRAKFILLNRDIRDVLASYLTTWCDGSFQRFYDDWHMQNDIKVMYPHFKVIYDRLENGPNVLRLEFRDLITSTDSCLAKAAEFLQLPVGSIRKNYSHLRNISFRMGDPKSVHQYSSPVDLKKAGGAMLDSATLQRIDSYLSTL